MPLVTLDTRVPLAEPQFLSVFFVAQTKPDICKDLELPESGCGPPTPLEPPPTVPALPTSSACSGGPDEGQRTEMILIFLLPNSACTLLAVIPLSLLGVKARFRGPGEHH